MIHKSWCCKCEQNIWTKSILKANKHRERGEKFKREGSWGWRDRHPHRSRVQQNGFTIQAVVNPSLQSEKQRERVFWTHCPTNLAEMSYQTPGTVRESVQDNKVKSI